MNEITSHEASTNETSAGTGLSRFLIFDNLTSFTKAVEEVTGTVFDFTSILKLGTNFLEQVGKYLILNVKEYEREEQNNLLFLTEDKAFLLSRVRPSPEAADTYEDVLSKPFGPSTILAYLTLSRVMESNKQRLETLNAGIKKLLEKFDSATYHELAPEFERLSDRLEEFHDLLLKLQETRYKHVETQYIAFDYSILLAESVSLQGRCRRRLTVLKDLHQDHETQTTAELNLRIARLNDVVKKLTSLTVILMIPTLIASHFGMNFVNMPELNIWWVYPVVIIAQFVVMGIGFLIFRKLGWL